jgi:hypothetical protein
MLISPHGCNWIVKFNANQRETWDERLHRIKETMAPKLGLSKYRCPYFYCCGAGGLY